ncbi:MAG: DUF3006 domain-containing protein [Ruminococcus sp.]|jgi:hypothetical protein|nr:DUF3006 domain-containing protein [Ruminococcus sp.]
MKKFIVDRIEEGRAVLECENKECVSLEITSLPKGIKEGDVLMFEQGSYFLNAQETEQRKQKLQKLMSSLFEQE